MLDHVIQLSNFKNAFWRDTNAGVRQLHLLRNHMSDVGVTEWIHVLSPATAQAATGAVIAGTTKEAARESKTEKKETTKEGSRGTTERMGDVTSCHVMSCNIMSCHLISCHAM